jgi:hypothetical protein
VVAVCGTWSEGVRASDFTQSVVVVTTSPLPILQSLLFSHDASGKFTEIDAYLNHLMIHASTNEYSY